jgi:hypothetical protein
MVIMWRKEKANASAGSSGSAGGLISFMGIILLLLHAKLHSPITLHQSSGKFGRMLLLQIDDEGLKQNNSSK